MKAISDDYIENAFDGGEVSSWKIQAFTWNYKRFFPKTLDAAVLDIGIGRGEMLFCMREWGYETYRGIDISNSAVNCCRKQGFQCELVEDSVKFLRDHRAEFTCITLLDVVEHIHQKELPEFMTAVHDALVPEGKVIIQTPNMQAPFAAALRYPLRRQCCCGTSR